MLVLLTRPGPTLCARRPSRDALVAKWPHALFSSDALAAVDLGLMLPVRPPDSWLYPLARSVRAAFISDALATLYSAAASESGS